MSKIFSPLDLRFMRQALTLAQRGEGLCSPNPCVGAVVVRGSRVIGRGWHQQAGGPHAEVHAVADARRRGHRLAGATLYVTLEPCCTHGRTPPCTDLILREKIKRVVVAATDPNPRHAGRGYAVLRRSGIEVVTGVLAGEANELNRDFNHWITTGKPWVILKMAMGLDGNITPPPGESPWITGKEALRRVQEMRWSADAILIGAETARQDNPRLTVRLPGKTGKIQPWRVILTRSGKLPKHLGIFSDRHRDRTVVYQGKPWNHLLSDLGKRGVKRLLVEGGGVLAGEILAHGRVHEIAFFVAPMLLGTRSPVTVWPGKGLRQRRTLRQMTCEPVGKDFLIRGRF